MTYEEAMRSIDALCDKNVEKHAKDCPINGEPYLLDDCKCAVGINHRIALLARAALRQNGAKGFDEYGNREV